MLLIIWPNGEMGVITEVKNDSESLGVLTYFYWIINEIDWTLAIALSNV